MRKHTVLTFDEFIKKVKNHEEWPAKGSPFALCGYKLPRVELKGVNLSGCIFDDCVFDPRSTFSECKFCRSTFRNCDLGGVKFVNCDLEDANFSKSLLQNAAILDSDARGCCFEGSTLNGCDMSGSRITDVCWPWNIESLHVNIDDNQVYQMLYHVVSCGLNSENTSEYVKNLLGGLIDDANKAVSFGSLYDPLKYEGKTLPKSKKDDAGRCDDACEPANVVPDEIFLVEYGSQYSNDAWKPMCVCLTEEDAKGYVKSRITKGYANEALFHINRIMVFKDWNNPEEHEGYKKILDYIRNIDVWTEASMRILTSMWTIHCTNYGLSKGSAKYSLLLRDIWDILQSKKSFDSFYEYLTAFYDGMSRLL